MNIAITGATGFIGRHVAARLRQHTIRHISTRGALDLQAFSGCNAVIHLAGEPVAQRWTPEARRKIRSSRIEGTRAIVELIRRQSAAILISASAVGYYGSRGDESLTESSPPGDDFLSQLAVEWEREALAAEKFGVRVVALRMGMVLGCDGGALEKMLPPFRYGIGGRIGNGEQWMSWIHIADLVDLIAFLLDHRVYGPVNATAPNPVTNAEFTQDLADALHRPAILPVPKFVLKLFFGEMSQIIFASQRVLPEAAQRAGFEFRFPELGAALADLLHSPR